MDRETYEMMSKMMDQLPPKKETPEGQKFHIGEIVKISTPTHWFSQRNYDENKDRLYQIEYSYQQKFGGSNERGLKRYSLKHLFEDNSSCWYDEESLELVKSINEINEEKDLAEYKRLKKKYEGT